MITFAFITITSFTVSYLFYKIDAHNIIYNSIDRKYRKWKKLNRLISSQHKTTFSVYSVSLEMVLKTLYISFLQYMNTSVTKLDKNTYEIDYVVGGKLYRMIAIPKKGPCPILQIRDEYDNDITNRILPYYGPNYDWYSISFIPQFFKCKIMVFAMQDGQEKIFNEHDYIILE
jgi:hypothetical protein